MRHAPRWWRAAFCGAFLLVAGCAAAGSPPRYQIGAWYFTLWHPDAASLQLGASAQLYGRRDPWGGVRDYAAGHGAFAIKDGSGHPVSYAGREPLAGFYDLSDPRAIDTQFAEGARAGLSFFAFYYYVDAATGLPQAISNVVRKFYDAPDRHGMSLLLAPMVSSATGAKMTPARFRTTLLPILTEYLASPAALRINGRPAIVDWWLDPEHAATEYAEMYADLRRAVRARTGRDPFIIKLLAANVTPPDVHDAVWRLHPDAFTCFAFPMRPAEPYGEWAAGYGPAMRRQMAGADPVVYLPCAGTGQDARPWYKVGWFKPPIDGRGYTVGITPAGFRDALLHTRSIMDEGRDPMRVAILYAWNEWGEAEADIEPSKVSGYAYADVMRQVFGLAP